MKLLRDQAIIRADAASRPERDGPFSGSSSRYILDWCSMHFFQEPASNPDQAGDRPFGTVLHTHGEPAGRGIARVDVLEVPLQPPGWGEAVLDVLRAGWRFCDERLGWNRIGFVLSVAMIAMAATVLARILRHIRGAEVVQALLTANVRDIIWAAVFVAGGYLTLTFYDLFALRTIGWSRIPYRVAMLASFTSYSIGHNVGASVLTGGAVRYRIYSSWGLDAVAVAKLCFVAGLTFWLGNATVLGLGVAYVPTAASAIDQMPAWLNRALALGILAVLASYVVWVWRRPREMGRRGWKVVLPDGPLTLLQIGIGIIDLACCALAMYMLLPVEPNIGFVTLAVIFVAATLLGFASHAPGGIGVFDAAMLVALWQFDKEKLLAGLLLFRLLYYVVPLVIALVILGGRELILGLPSPSGAPPAGEAHPDRASTGSGLNKNLL
jgi:glycosyltransferase 2 family protein